MPTFTDNFTRADAASLGANWTDAFFFPPSPSDYFSILTNRAHIVDLVGGPNAGARCLGIGAFQDWDISADVRHNATNGAWIGLIARATADNTFYFCIARNDATKTVVLRKNVGGTVTQIGSATVTWPDNTDKPLRLSVQGTLLKVFFDGAEVISTTDSDITAAGDCGMYAANGTVGATADADNFSATGTTSFADFILPIQMRVTVNLDQVIPLQFRYVLNADSGIPIEWDISGLIRSDHAVPLQFRTQINADSAIPISIQLPGGVTVDFLIPIQMRRQLNTDQIIPILWKLFSDWVAQAAGQADAWAPQSAGQADAWTKQAAGQADAWSKV